jgi:carbamate kinase
VTAIAVVAVGGNALVREGEEATYGQQRKNALPVARAIVGLADAGFRVAVSHGNGPQVGCLALQQERAADLVPRQPLFVLGAMTQGQIGHLLAFALREVIGDRAIEPVALVTHVVVDGADPGFTRPTKPIGPFFSLEEGRELAERYGWRVEEDAHRGHRRVVPSPAPVAIVEARAVRVLVEAGFLVIASGGGGIPTVEPIGDPLAGVDAVVDKDLAAARLAAAIGARVLVLATAVDRVLLGFGTPLAAPVEEITDDEAESLLRNGQFAAGSMAPKIEAAIRFLRDGGELVVITSPEHVLEAVRGDHGTRVVQGRAGATFAR